MNIQNLITHIQDAVFPRFCIHCRKSGSLLCEACFPMWQTGPLAFEPHESLVHAFAYADPVARGLICAWKYSYDSSAWENISRRLKTSLGLLAHICHAKGIEAIVPVPLHRMRACERGFDQAREIALFLSHELDIPVIDALKRWRLTGHQARRADDERKEAMQDNPFILTQKLPGHVLLVDDVWTTGATMRAAKDVLNTHREHTACMFTLAKG